VGHAEAETRADSTGRAYRFATPVVAPSRVQAQEDLLLGTSPNRLASSSGSLGYDSQRRNALPSPAQSKMTDLSYEQACRDFEVRAIRACWALQRIYRQYHTHKRDS
jgi:hypothetical protein